MRINASNSAKPEPHSLDVSGRAAAEASFASGSALESGMPPRTDGFLRRMTQTLTSSGERARLSSFGLAIVATILGALAATSMISLYLLQGCLDQRQSQSAPTVMSVLVNSVRESARASPDSVRRLVSDISRLPNIRGCVVTLAALPDQKETRFASDSDHGEETTLHLKTEILERPTPGGGDDGQPLKRLGTLEVAFESPWVGAAPAILTALWTAAGAVAAVSLAAFAFVFRRFTKRMRPIAFVRDNLLAYHTGIEKSLALLEVHDSASSIAQAWNSLIAFVDEMQDELKQVRCRQTIADSLLATQDNAGQEILNFLPIGVLHIDAEEVLTYCNHSAARLLNISPELSAEGDSERPASPTLASRIHDPGLLDAIRGLRLDPGGRSATADSRLKAAGMGHIDYQIGDGREAAEAPDSVGTVVRLTPVPIADRGADSACDDLVIMVQDVSQLIEAERSRDAFLAHITHELRTPLTNIRAYAETLTEDFFDDEKTRRECYNVITSETRRLSRLIEDVLSVSQIEAGVSRLERVTLRVDQTLRSAVQEVQATADAHSIELSLRIPSKIAPVVGDRLRLHQVWVNLLGNALKYTPDGGSVSVSVQSDESVVRVCVSDTGMGIAKEHHTKIFEKFYRVPAANKIEGTGLGLSITRDIIRMHGGVIHVESELGSGSTFIVEIPRASESSSAADATGELEHGTTRHS